MLQRTDEAEAALSQARAFHRTDPETVSARHLLILRSRSPLTEDRPVGHRIETYDRWLGDLTKSEGGLASFSKGYEHFGLLPQPDGSIVYREWAPGVTSANLIGDFNGWNRESHPMKRDQYGRWEITLPPLADGKEAIPHGSKVKVSPATVCAAPRRQADELRMAVWVQISMTTPSGERIERLPAWIRCVS